MIYTNSDGGSRGNPGRGAIGVLVRKDDSILTMHSEKIGIVTNNIAEYVALIRVLEMALEFTKEKLICFLDSELLVKQLLGKYKVRNPYLMKLFLRVQKLQDNFDRIEYIHVSRWDKFQRIVDIMLNEELDK